jgi:hypothetical protein
MLESAHALATVVGEASLAKYLQLRRALIISFFHRRFLTGWFDSCPDGYVDYSPGYCDGMVVRPYEFLSSEKLDEFEVWQFLVGFERHLLNQSGGKETLDVYRLDFHVGLYLFPSREHPVLVTWRCMLAKVLFH